MISSYLQQQRHHETKPIVNYFLPLVHCLAKKYHTALEDETMRHPVCLSSAVIVFAFTRITEAFSSSLPAKHRSRHYQHQDHSQRGGRTILDHEIHRNQFILMRGGDSQLHAPFVLSATTSSSRDDHDDDSTDTNSNTRRQQQKTHPLTILATALFKGMTLPFPALRDLTAKQQQQPTTEQQDGSATTTRIGFTLRESIAAIVIYLGLGVLSYSSVLRGSPQAKASSWSLVDALYFGVVTFTSVGYGDLCPTTYAGKAFTIVFGLTGIALLGTAVATIGSRLVARETEMVKAAEEASRKRIMELFQGRHKMTQPQSNSMTTKMKGSTTAPMTVSSTTYKGSSSVVSSDSTSPTTRVPMWWNHILGLVRKSIPAFSLLCLGGILMGRIEGWNTFDSIYHAFVTASTLGYGDFSPVTRKGRIYAIFFVPLAVAAAGEVLGSVASTLMERRQEQAYAQMMQRQLNLDRLLEMDTDNDGKVSREEYVAFMLQEMNLVTTEQLDELHTQFEKLDVDGGGYLDKNDLKAPPVNATST